MLNLICSIIALQLASMVVISAALQSKCNLLVIGGEDSHLPLKNVDEFDFGTNQWRNITDLPQPLSRMGAAVFNGKVYAIGGQTKYADQPHCLSSVYEYDQNKKSWSSSVQGLNQARCRGRAAVLFDMMYVTGGEINDTATLYSMEILSMSESKWTNSTIGMPTMRSRHGSVVLSDELYLVGGSQSSLRDVVKTVDKFNSKAGSWTEVPAMHTARANHGVAVLNGKLYAVGGIDYRTLEVLKSVEVFDPANNTWSDVAPLDVARYGLSAVAYNGYIYAIGGFDKSHTAFDTMLVYDPANNKWTPSESHLTRARGNSAVVVLCNNASRGLVICSYLKIILFTLSILVFWQHSNHA